MSLYYCLVPKMVNAVVLLVMVYFCVTSVNRRIECKYTIKNMIVLFTVLSKQFFLVKHVSQFAMVFHQYVFVGVYLSNLFV